MKYWNKSKQVRLKHWSCVKLKLDVTSRSLIGSFHGWLTYTAFNNLKIELQRHPSKNKFFMHPMHKEVWFESAKDATCYKIKYSEILR